MMIGNHCGQSHSSGQNLPQCFDEQSSTSSVEQPLRLDKTHRQQDKRITSHDYNLIIHSPKLDGGQAMIKEHKKYTKQVEKSRDRRVHEQNEREPRLKKSVIKKVEAPRLTADFPSDNKDSSNDMCDQALAFCKKVKERLDNSDDYRAFLKSLHMYKSGIITMDQLNDMVFTLLTKFPNLMDEYNDFARESFDREGQLLRSSKLEDKDRDHKCEVDVSKEREENHEKYTWKSIRELDLRDFECCGSSYQRVPDDHPIPISSGRSELDAEVLNDHWVSVTPGSEDRSFKHMTKNQYEQSLFKCEDDQFELDLLIERAKSTSECIKVLYNRIMKKEINIEVPILVEEHFSVLHLKCIERVYGGYGREVIEASLQNPTVALPKMFRRLKQKEEEWKECRSELNKVWAELYAKNFYKSLCYRSLQFKQQDSKNLKPFMEDVSFSHRKKRKTSSEHNKGDFTGFYQIVREQLQVIKN